MCAACRKKSALEVEAAALTLASFAEDTRELRRRLWDAAHAEPEPESGGVRLSSESVLHENATAERAVSAGQTTAATASSERLEWFALDVHQRANSQFAWRYSCDNLLYEYTQCQLKLNQINLPQVYETSSVRCAKFASLLIISGVVEGVCFWFEKWLNYWFLFSTFLMYS